jgi:transcriptional regulator with XRE-family HTH domain
MDASERKALEAAGFRVGTVAEFLGLTEAEERLVELRVRLVKAIRRLREAQGISQTALARELKSSQSRIAKIEAGDPGVSLDLTLKGYFALGGDLAGLIADPGTRQRRKSSIRRPVANKTAPKRNAQIASTKNASR